ncbi:hypothetical protein [Paraburkholderia caballeronis]|uniref:hypothetical protein n=1 Tax=Paraburkholderia caballeronis TaxID=416943 RepID=UPI0010646B48|nr:hypothetical protein [Paraburkholderia caballeronis]TDV11603.1 hypothetical protein C7406_12079 [Paraburkholderia caballeronis]TDV17390.1 hypothetical protein C7408_10443 [Paraburkholderia caballeronis]TDV27408.1 hypothetical protein C7404_10443 [Paraburkholderia caballeronis]TDV36142.1 hypothetical protein C7405_10443 [Paraburkholderia caballeronis]
MKKISLAVLVTLSALTGAAYAQTDDSSGIRMSTDPQVAASIEQHAQDLQSQQQEAPTQQPMHRGMHHRKHAK